MERYLLNSLLTNVLKSLGYATAHLGGARYDMRRQKEIDNPNIDGHCLCKWSPHHRVVPLFPHLQNDTPEPPQTISDFALGFRHKLRLSPCTRVSHVLLESVW